MDDVAEGQTAYVRFLTDVVTSDASPHSHSSARWKFQWGRVVSLLLVAGIICVVLGVTIPFILWTQVLDLDASVHSLLSKQNRLAFDDYGRPNDISLWTHHDYVREFSSFTERFNKTYSSPAERKRRLDIFQKNFIYIDEQNQQNHPYVLKMNTFGDMTTKEFQNHRKCLTSRKQRSTLFGASNRVVDTSLSTIDEADIPTSIDWRDKGCVSEVKDQEDCGSCWAFSATGALEGARCAKTGVMVSLSEQQLIDCGGGEGNMGCNGGELDTAFQYIVDVGGLCTEEAYPYVAKEMGFCAVRICDKTTFVRSFKDVPPRNDAALRAALAMHGPVSVSIDAEGDDFRFYHHGVFNTTCGTELDHAVLAVGYGTDEKTGLGYFILKNSWGASWGDQGFMKMVRLPVLPGNSTGECGILSEPAFPSV